MEMSTNIDALAAALAKAQGEMENAKKSSDNPYFKSKYADLAEVLSVAREPLAKNGLSIMQASEGVANGYMSVTTLLLHSSGQFIKATGTFPIGKQDPQGAGSALTYARRYSLAAMLGIAQEGEDDDANAACGKQQNRQQTQAQPKQAQPASQQTQAQPQATGDKYVRITPQGDVLVAVNGGKDANGRNLIKYEDIKVARFETLDAILKDARYKLAHQAIQNLLKQDFSAEEINAFMEQKP